jgi:hypothetical protein
MTVLASGLETDDYGQPDWWALYNRNVELLNDVLLKVQGLLDVKVDKLVDGAMLRWDGTKWRVITFP